MFFALFVIGYMFNLFIGYFILAVLCSHGWHESLGNMSACVCFLYIANSNFSFSRCIVISRKQIVLCCSFSVVNFMFFVVY
jgi:hypothetical protein